jgi:glycosyltransferase A (GT-A) superfamily protein (DUF2064 family)
VIDTVLVIAKEPIPGRVKTRLVPPLTHDQAARIAGAALGDTLAVASLVRARHQVLVLDGVPGPWLPSGWQCRGQVPGGLDQRLAGAFEHARGPAVLVGMDTPQLQPGHLAAFDPASFDACLGLAVDGGYWAIGFADPGRAAAVITGVPMSCSHTGAEQRRRMRAAGMRIQILDVLEDVDTVDAALRVSSNCRPSSEFARTVRQIGLAMGIASLATASASKRAVPA